MVSGWFKYGHRACLIKSVGDATEYVGSRAVQILNHSLRAQARIRGEANWDEVRASEEWAERLRADIRSGNFEQALQQFPTAAARCRFYEAAAIHIAEHDRPACIETVLQGRIPMPSL